VDSSFDQTPLILYSSHNNPAEQDCACADDGSAPVVWCSSPGKQCEVDCACSDAVSSVGSPWLTAVATAWQRAPGLYRAPLPGGHELAFNPLGPVSLTVLNGAACARRLHRARGPGRNRRRVAWPGSRSRYPDGRRAGAVGAFAALAFCRAARFCPAVHPHRLAARHQCLQHALVTAQAYKILTLS
jgi:hypothetical protein